VIEITLEADQAMSPVGVDRPAAAKEGGVNRGGGAPDVDELPAGWPGWVKVPRYRPGRARWRSRTAAEAPLV
jgi:hypothetical protein